MSISTSTSLVVSLQSLFGDEARILRDRNYQFLLLAALFPILGISLISPVLNSLLDPFNATSANIGLMISVYTAPPIVLIPVAGWLADKFGRKLVLVSSLMLFGLAGVAIAFSTDFQTALSLRFLQGVSFAGLNPIIITSIGDLYDGDREATGQGIRFMFSSFSSTIFPLLAGVLVILAWQYPFLLYGLAIPAALALLLWFEEPSPQEPSIKNPHDSVSYPRLLIRLARQPRVLALLFARVLMIPIWIGFITYNSLIVSRGLHGTPFVAGLLVALGFFVMGISASQAGRITSMVDSRLYPLIAANVCVGVGFIAVLFAPTLLIALVGIAIAGSGFGILGSLYRSIITGFAPPDLRAGLVGVSESGGRLASTLTPLVMGAVIGSLSPAIGLIAALRTAGVGLVVVAGGGGILCLLIANASPPISPD